MQNIKKKISAAILGGILALSALLLCACKGVIAAEEAGVTVENALGYAVNELYIYPNNTSNWGNNLLTAPMEQSGAVLTYLSALTGGNREGMFNIQLIDSDGDIYSFSNVQIADGDALTLTFNDSYVPVAQLAAQSGETRLAVGELTINGDPAENNFTGLWTVMEDNSILYVFEEDGSFRGLDMSDNASVVATGTYTFADDTGVLTAAEGGTPVDMEMQLSGDGMLTVTYDSESILMFRQGGADELEAVLAAYVQAEPSATVQVSDPTVVADRTYSSEEGNRVRFRDYDLGLFASYPEWMSALEDYIPGAVAVTDGMSGYAVLRDVTDEYWAYSGSNDEYVTQYINDYVLGDYAVLYESDGLDYTSFELVNSNVSNRIATVKINLFSTNYDIQVQTLVFTSTYDNGDSRVIAKTILAAYDDPAQFQTLYDEVKSGDCRH